MTKRTDAGTPRNHIRMYPMAPFSEFCVFMLRFSFVSLLLDEQCSCRSEHMVASCTVERTLLDRFPFGVERSPCPRTLKRALYDEKCKLL
jgi:hypothetical protein